MLPGNYYVIRRATDEDQRILHQLAQVDDRRPLSGPALTGEIDGIPAAALSLADGRLIADPFQPTAVLSQVLRLRASALNAYSRTPSLAERVRAAMAPFLAAQGNQA
jgi:hypothetical protein